ncbi:MAG: hypothetical protein AABW86_00185 [Candidatus Micrarchaeota archaeon]
MSIKSIQKPALTNFSGTIIDLETIGSFDRQYSDSRAYANHKIVIFGAISGGALIQHYIDSSEHISLLASVIEQFLNSFPRPFHSFNTHFEVGVLSHALGRRITFEKELNRTKYEKKQHVVIGLEIPEYEDPFFGDGFKCMEAWKTGVEGVQKALAHNRACLLKERDILLKRGSREPEPIEIRF